MQSAANQLSPQIMAQQLYKKGVEYYHTNDLENARNIFHEINKTPMANAQSLQMEGKCYVKARQFGNALPLLEAALKLDPENPGILEKLCMSYHHLEDYEQSNDCYDKLIRLYPDGLDDLFNRIYSKALRTSRSTPFPIERRRRFWYLAQTFFNTMLMSDEGDVVECGCYRGLSSNMLSQYWFEIDPDFTGHGFHLMDSFEGLSEPTSDDHIPDDLPNAASLRSMSHKGCFSATYDHVKESLKDYPDITFYKGWLPATLADLPTDGRYRFVNIDVDIYEPTFGCFEYFWPRLVKGGVIISDDYNWPGARKAINQVKDTLEEGTYQFTTTEFGQAILRKMV